jgi:predicted ATP-dependent serine protease
LETTERRKMKDILKYLTDNKITIEDLQEEVEYLIPEFLVRQSLNPIFAMGGQGKSWLMLGICLHLLKEREINKCYYLDMDNSKATLKSRKIDKCINEYEDLIYIHRSKFNEKPIELLKQLSKQCEDAPEEFDNTLFIFDSIRDFMVGSKDMNSDKDVMPILAYLKDLREAGATVIFLHHTTKDSGGKQFKGSTSFRDSVDVAYSLTSKRNKDSLVYTLYVDKDRLSVEDCVFELDTSTMDLKSENMVVSQMSEQEKKLTGFVIATLDLFDELNQSELIEKCKGITSEKTTRKYLHKHSGKLWHKETRPKENNATYYISIDKVPSIPSLPNPEF